jgi:hypothetical protein
MLLALAILVGTPTGWQLPENATQVQVLRGTVTSYVAPSEVGPSERIKACDSETVRIGSNDTCPEASRAPGRTDVWWLKSEVFATPNPEPSLEPGAVRIRFSVHGPIRFADDNSVVPDGIPIYVRVYENGMLIASVPWTPVVTLVRSVPQDETRCWYGTLWVDADKSGTIDAGTNGSEESRTKNDTCSRGLPIPDAGPGNTPQAVAAPIIEALQPGESPPP